MVSTVLHGPKRIQSIANNIMVRLRAQNVAKKQNTTSQNYCVKNIGQSGQMTEKPAKDVKGFLLYNPITEKYWFRVYGEIDPVTKRKTYTDYALWAEDIEVTINASGLSLYEDDKNRLDWSSKLLRPKT